MVRLRTSHEKNRTNWVLRVSDECKAAEVTVFVMKAPARYIGSDAHDFQMIIRTVSEND